MIDLAHLHSILGWALAGFYWLLTASVTLRIIARRRPVSVTLAWLLIIYILPLLGAALYLLIGELNLGRARAARSNAMVEPYLTNLTTQFQDSEAPLPGGQLSLAINQLMNTQVGIGALSYEHLEILDTPASIFERVMQDIRNARQSIMLETYIWHPGGLVDEVARELIAASLRGVEVRLLIDHAGSRDFFRSVWRTTMVQAGIKVVPALPVRLIRALVQRIDLRLHRKLIVIDDLIAYTGSMNMADPAYFKQEAQVGQWIDMMLRLEGEAAAGLTKVFAWDWEVETGERCFPSLAERPGLPSNWLSIIPSGPGLGNLINQTVLASIYRANKSIVISTPYFVPSEAVLDALCQAANRGVEVKLLLPRKNDSLMVGWASRSYFDTLLESGVQILLFDGGLLHTKAMLMDEQLALVGSVNLDIRSFQLNFELTVALFTPDNCAAIGALLRRYERDSERLQAERWGQRGRPSRILERLMFFMSPLL
ncbi:cardiolipin synthetase [Pseudomonas saudimassiliensis]|uniref:Cardiolipin synthase n=1 Tax=Pseudomonas saudimassiliensis TaxID=1461581 RepID=A0A078MK39_9PSED|nr:cardiolipin synthase [Pseudomonas saudimassiliensis]CEA05111.1 cardiolipin synthetase [Pseudomonas saudimassiliensis]CEF26954.1 cardiolipin synthetase [Pseudomonas saudimassiliensis]